MNTFSKSSGFGKALIPLLLGFITIFFFYLAYANTRLAHADSPVTLSAGTVSVITGNSVDVPISIDPTLSTLKPTSIQWDFVFNTSQISSIIWKSDGPAAINASKSGNCNPISSGLVRCLVVGLNTNQIGQGQLGIVTVKTATSTFNGSIPLQFSNVIAADANASSVPVTAINGTLIINQSGQGGTTTPTLIVSCTPSNTSAFAGNTFTWNANVSGGTGNYTYVWSGTDNLAGSGQSATITYANEGSKTAAIQVTSGTQTVTAQCGPVNITLAPITGVCTVGVTPNFNSQYSINWNAFAQSPASNQNLTYSWTGTDGLAGTNSNIYKTYTTTGLKTGTVTVNGGAQSFSLTCSADVPTLPTTATTTNPLNGSCTPSINGMTVTWGASAGGGNGSANGNPITYSWSGSDGLTSTTSTTSSLQQTYTTEGTKSATVIIQSGSDSLTLTCQARIASTTPNSGHCFIATAAYGTPMEPEVMVLRHFRDEALLTNKVGTAMTDVYYEVSPPIAEFIRPHESLKALVRLGLEPIIFGLEKMGYTQ